MIVVRLKDNQEIIGILWDDFQENGNLPSSYDDANNQNYEFANLTACSETIDGMFSYNLEGQMPLEAFSYLNFSIYETDNDEKFEKVLSSIPNRNNFSRLVYVDLHMQRFGFLYNNETQIFYFSSVNLLDGKLDISNNCRINGMHYNQSSSELSLNMSVYGNNHNIFSSQNVVVGHADNLNATFMFFDISDFTESVNCIPRTTHDRASRVITISNLQFSFELNFIQKKSVA